MEWKPTYLSFKEFVAVDKSPQLKKKSQMPLRKAKTQQLSMIMKDRMHISDLGMESKH